MKSIISVLLFFFLSVPSACFAEGNHMAVDIWGLSHHADRNRNFNERNWGLGLRMYHDNWFFAVDDMRNSVRGRTLSAGVGYEYPLFNVEDYTFSVAAEATHLDYEIPGRGTIHRFVVLPGVSVRKGNLSGNIAIVPPRGGRESVLLFFATWHFNPSW